MRTQRAFGCAIVSSLVFGSSVVVAAPDDAARQYQVIELGSFRHSAELDFTSPSINERHEVAWTAATENFGSKAMMWLPESRFGLAAQQAIDLSALGGQSLGGGADDINADGVVVGFVNHLDEFGSEFTRAFVWRLEPAGGVTTVELRPLTTVSGAPGYAFAVGAGTSPTIVGRALTDFVFFPARQFGAFTYDFQPSPPVQDVVSLNMSGDNQTSTAHDIANGSIPFVAGEVENFGQPGCWAGERGWLLGADGLPNSTLPVADPDAGGNAFGVNDAGQAVGFAMRRVGADLLDCEQRAVIWDLGASAQTDLPDSTNGIAVRISNAAADGSLSVVGANGEAVRWHQAADGAWTKVSLQSRVSPLHDLDLAVASDVSDDGWIVGHAVRGTEKRAFLLKPIDLCPGDIDGDGSVGGGDLGILLSNFGTLDESVMAGNADLTMDGHVDGGDLGVLLSNWGANCTP